MVSNIRLFAYRLQLMELWNRGFKTDILKDNNFTAEAIVYKLPATKKYILKKYFLDSPEGYILRADLKQD